MKLYHYAPKENTALKDGLLCVSKIPARLKVYAKRAGTEDPKEIIKWLEKTFEGRSRAVSALTEPIKWQGNDVVLKKIVDGSTLFSFELDDLIKDNLVEAIYLKKCSDADGYNEKFEKITMRKIDCSPLDWGKVNTSKGLLYGVIRHYLIVLKDGYIPPHYLKRE